MRSDPLILAFDTSAAHCAAALMQGDTLLAQRHDDMPRGQAEHLLPLLEHVLATGGAGWRDLDMLAVGVGPGNFTGIRISVAAARGLALGLKRPAIGVPVFDARAEGLPRPLYVIEDARRDEVYLQHFAPDPGVPQLLSLHDAALQVGDATLTGSGAHLLGGARVLAPRHGLAESIARVARRRAGAENPAPAPLYIRPADAAPSAAVPVTILP
ncbi:tRNA (adenosine(37)-N6)-threonylcarbamoyltransferase complex dimerization subunit type 1 TsaB [Roseinatronobacter alkalisoli]|uniref:tRNA (Adenosine(37)-N6)-threonylcarbamoyltransferase complex dimerization subunit type 1 TsaB n=1 Tax=Roseinatronobacter alkalisoli TaxID=3028235 RepID=A0ABT5T5G6_9RHOB|nr:tRNA (adenosine(37)-N6)-threonylcarbamoyltransferase complex dimerization subunit type 1 TsaB [Roseinatronobacter sp. HJB301]MDD7970362.1 tRNA (adenosine(37)-N6)-threonylcarbamoyltransferase complex dimerization subunit type 1 TsaB [Roseinatronobacter sp. HJB301]